MEIFTFDLCISHAEIAPDADGNFTLEGIVWGDCSTPIEVGRDGSPGALRLGLRISEQLDTSKAVFENRAEFFQPIISCEHSNTFRVKFDNVFSNGTTLYLLLSFLYEGEFWFFSKGIDPYMFLAAYDGGVLKLAVCESEPRDLNKESKALSFVSMPSLDKSDPQLLFEFAKSLELIRTRFGARIAIQFGYQYALGRRADVGGLLDKERALADHSTTIADVCAALIQSEEFRNRNCAFLPHPDRVLSIWASC